MAAPTRPCATLIHPPIGAGPSVSGVRTSVAGHSETYCINDGRDHPSRLNSGFSAAR